MQIKPKNGFNPLWHKCSEGGCYISERHPKTEVFADCFPGKISMSDMDRIVERNGRALILEWKGFGGNLTQAQEIMWAKLTRGKMFTTVAVKGDPKTMEVWSFRLCWNGKWDDWQEANLARLKEGMKRWADWAEIHPVFSVRVNK